MPNGIMQFTPGFAQKAAPFKRPKIHRAVDPCEEGKRVPLDQRAAWNCNAVSKSRLCKTCWPEIHA